MANKRSLNLNQLQFLHRFEIRDCDGHNQNLLNRFIDFYSESCFTGLFPFLLPLFEAMEFSFFPNDAQEFFKRVAQQTIEARKKCGQVMHASNCVTYPVIGVTYICHWYLCIGICALV